MNDQLDGMDVNDILDATLDDLEDLPEYKAYPPGAHRVKLSMEIKEVNDKQVVEASFTYIEAVELADQQAEVPAEGSQANILCHLDNEFGRGTLKLLATPVGKALNTASTRDTIEQCTDIECLIVTAYKKNKDDPDSPYMKVKELAVV